MMYVILLKLLSYKINFFLAINQWECQEDMVRHIQETQGYNQLLTRLLYLLITLVKGHSLWQMSKIQYIAEHIVILKSCLCERNLNVNNFTYRFIANMGRKKCTSTIFNFAQPKTSIHNRNKVKCRTNKSLF